jgi:hypothetical protein
MSVLDRDTTHGGPAAPDKPTVQCIRVRTPKDELDATHA